MKDKPKNIVLLHGWEARVDKLEPLKNALEARGWRVVNLKLPGFDLAAPETHWSLEEYADFVKSQVDHELRAKSLPRGEAVRGYVLFGHSFGGRLAITLASQKPQNLTHLILCAPGGLSRPSLVKRAPLWLAAKIGKLIFAVVPGGAIVEKSLYKLAREHDYQKTSGIMREVFKKIVKENVKRNIHRIKVPTLILWGKTDKMTPYADALVVQKLLSKATLVSFDDVGHRLPYEKPLEIAQEIDQWFGR
ncbi:MAG: alpha/beta hydrolase [Candidatus Chisholmbacteria bacterium]|nr:alpha/beta hydrolase [Candidatus Chisholmbacteria bacterium]